VPIVGAIVKPIRSEDAVINKIYLTVAAQISIQSPSHQPLIDEIYQVLKVYLARLNTAVAGVG
jgi:DNA-binding protein Fis